MPAPAAEVIVDDRLATVLATAPAGPAAARTQFRQLLDLLGRMPPDFALPAPALARLAELERALPDDERAELLRASPASLRHPGLILRLAAQPPVVATAAISAARLDDWQWSALALELPLPARGHLRHRRDLGPRTRAVLARLGIADLGLPRPAGEASPLELEAADIVPETASEGEGIAAIVRRIEAFRRSRQAGTRQFGERPDDDGTEEPRLPLSDTPVRRAARPVAVAFATDADGRIATAEPPFAAMLAGARLTAGSPHAPARCDGATARAMRQRRPVHGGRLELAGAEAIAGPWRIDAAPRFDPVAGRFLGYRGVLRRPSGEQPGADEPSDRIRQLVHELRTPVNAIQGFAELIQQQLFGPTPHQYRGLAASIAADSAAILAGFEEIDRLARFESGRGDDVSGHCDLAALLARLVSQFARATEPREVRLAFDSAGRAPVAMAEAEAERMLWRVLAVLAAAARPGETLRLELSADRDGIALALPLPASLAERDEPALFAVAPPLEPAAPGLALLGEGFALRLARAEAAAAGGSLRRDGARLVLRLPGLTPWADANSPGEGEPTGRAGGA